MVKKENKKLSKNTIIIDDLIDSNKKISKLVKETRRKNIKSVSLVIDYNEEEKINKKKAKQHKKSNHKKTNDNKKAEIDTKIYPLIEINDDSIQNNLPKDLEVVEKKESNKKLDNKKEINIEKPTDNNKQEINDDSIQNNLSKDLEVVEKKESNKKLNNNQKINIEKINDKFVDINKIITEIIEKLKQNSNAKSISIFVNYDQKAKIKNKPKSKKNIIKKKIIKEKKEEQKIINDKNINSENKKRKDVKTKEIIKDKNPSKIEKENIEIKDLNTEELRILRIKRTASFKILNPFKSNSSKKNNKKK